MMLESTGMFEGPITDHRRLCRAATTPEGSGGMQSGNCALHQSAIEFGQLVASPLGIGQHSHL